MPRISPRRTDERDVGEHRCAAGRGVVPRRVSPSTASATSPALASVAVAEERVDLAPDHHADDAVDVGVGDLAAADELAVAQHGVAVADLEHLLEAVGDEDDAEALRLEVADDAEELLHLASAESAEVGSSMTIRRDFIESARAISTICCSATERSRTSVIGLASSPMPVA